MGGFRTRRLIVGVDPGLNCGLAILALDGVPLLIESHRGWSLEKVIERITGVGEPTIISSDVSPAPSFLRKLSRKLNAVLFEPVISMGSEEKHKLAQTYVERYGIRVENAHEVDALAAAIKAYQHYKNKFEQVDIRLKEMGIDLPPDDVKDLVARGCSIARAIKILREPAIAKEPITRAVRGAVTSRERMRAIIEELTARLMLEKERSRRLRIANRELQAKIRTLEMEVEGLKEALDRARSEQTAQIRREREYQRLVEEIGLLKGRISELEAQIEFYRQMISRLQQVGELESRDGLILLKPIETFTREGLEKAFRIYNVRVGDVVFILDPSGGGPTTAERLARRGVKAVVIRGVMSHQALEVFEKYYVPVISADRINIRWIDGLPYTDPEEIKRIIKCGDVIKSSDELRMLKTIIDEHLREIGGKS
ncbi:MAG: DUF460 domain-containing protein [Candidatus Bathyarchaeia archaeon]|nr:DUF460 domain-containing protein [Candidatus Bathyarchaeota archaeon]